MSKGCRMRSLLSLCVWACLFCGAFAQLSSLITNAPECGLKCALQIFSDPEFSHKTQAELCHDKAFATVMGDCVAKGCRFGETMEFKRISKETCGITPMDQYTEFQVTGITMTTMAVVFYALRLICKILGPTLWGIDDTLISASAALLIPIFVFYQLLLGQGLGKEFENLSHRQVAAFFRYFFAFALLYHIALTCIKASILFLYLQIFPDGTFRRVAKWTVACNALFGLTFVVLTLTQAPVLLAVWKAWENKAVGEAMHNISWPSLVQSCLNLALDIWMIILPITQLYKLRLKISKKLGVIAMFGVGIFLTIVCAFKLYKMVDFMLDVSKSTQNGNDVIFWSYIELCVGIMVSCMPHTRQLKREVLRRLQPKGQGIGSSGSDGPYITRSIETITPVLSLDPVVLHDEGNLLTKL